MTSSCRISRPEVFCIKVFLQILQNSQEKSCARVSKERLWHKCFPVNFVKFLRTPFLAEHFCWLLLIMNFLPVIHHQKRKLGTSTFWLMMWKMTKIHKKLLLTNFEKSLSIWLSWKIQQHAFFIRLHKNPFFLLLETKDRVEKSCFYQNLWHLKK